MCVFLTIYHFLIFYFLLIYLFLFVSLLLPLFLFLLNTVPDSDNFEGRKKFCVKSSFVEKADINIFWIGDRTVYYIFILAQILIWQSLFLIRFCSLPPSDPSILPPLSSIHPAHLPLILPSYTPHPSLHPPASIPIHV